MPIATINWFAGKVILKTARTRLSFSVKKPHLREISKTRIAFRKISRKIISLYPKMRSGNIIKGQCIRAMRGLPVWSNREKSAFQSRLIKYVTYK
jgi:hypothetical protein